MKKILALLSLFLMFTACSSDDDQTPEEESASVIGTWFIVDSNVISLTECNKKSTATFNEDMTMDTVFFSETDGNCQSQNDTSQWKKETDGKYTIMIPNVGERTGDVIFEGSDRFIFNSDGMTFTFEK